MKKNTDSGSHKEANELEAKLLEVYPELKSLIEIIKEHDRMHEVSIMDIAYGELTAYGDQKPEEGPFWTILSEGSHGQNFFVMSFGLNPDNLSIILRRRNGMTGNGKTYKGNEIKQFFKEYPTGVCDLYKAWFVEEAERQKEFNQRLKQIEDASNNTIIGLWDYFSEDSFHACALLVKRNNEYFEVFYTNKPLKLGRYDIRICLENNRFVQVNIPLPPHIQHPFAFIAGSKFIKTAHEIETPSLPNMSNWHKYKELGFFTIMELNDILDFCRGWTEYAAYFAFKTLDTRYKRLIIYASESASLVRGAVLYFLNMGRKEVQDHFITLQLAHINNRVNLFDNNWTQEEVIQLIQEYEQERERILTKYEKERH